MIGYIIGIVIVVIIVILIRMQRTKDSGSSKGALNRLLEACCGHR